MISYTMLLCYILFCYIILDYMMFTMLYNNEIDYVLEYHIILYDINYIILSASLHLCREGSKNPAKGIEVGFSYISTVGMLRRKF